MVCLNVPSTTTIFPTTVIESTTPTITLAVPAGTKLSLRGREPVLHIALCLCADAMDPFSITSGAMGILLCFCPNPEALFNLYSIHDYYGGVKNAPQAMREIMKELEALDPVLYQLPVLALRSQPIPLLQEFSKDGGVIEMCQRELQELADGLQKRIEARGFHGRVLLVLDAWTWWM